MAIADAAVSISTGIAGSGTVTIQPGSGVQWALLDWGTSQWAGGTTADQDGYPNMDVEIYDGTNYVPVFYRGRVWFSNGFHMVQISNTKYARMKNTSASSADMYYSATITK